MRCEMSHKRQSRSRHDRRRPRAALARLPVASWLPRIVTLLRAVGPYVLMEILLPGGTLIAITVWLYRRYGSQVRSAGFAGGGVRQFHA